MAVTLTYDTTLSRIRIDATALAAATYATVERSTDQVRWTTVRGGVEATVTAGVMSTVDDYEFAPNVVNYYRVRGIVTDAPSFVSVGASDSGGSGSRTPGIPAGIVAGDAVFIHASTRNSGTGTVDTPTDWSQVAAAGNMAILGRIYDGVWTMPTVTFTGGAANEDTLARAAAFRTVDIVPAVSPAYLLNSSAQDIAHPGSVITTDDCTVLIAAWKQDDVTSIATLPGATAEISETSSTTGNDAAQVWDYILQTTATDIAAGSFTVTGGAAAISRSMVVVLPRQPYLNSQTDSITPALTEVWLKSTKRSFLNRAVQLGGPPVTPVRRARGTAHSVVGRSLPLATTDVRGSRAYELRIRTATADDAQTLDYILASGDTLFLHAPAGAGVPAGGVHILVSDTRQIRIHVTGEITHWSIPVMEVAAPGPDVVTATATWASVLAAYATWADVLAAHPTWESLLELVGSPSEVIVP